MDTARDPLALGDSGLVPGRPVDSRLSLEPEPDHVPADATSDQDQHRGVERALRHEGLPLREVCRGHREADREPSHGPPATAHASTAESAQATGIVGAPLLILAAVSIHRVLSTRPTLYATAAMTVYCPGWASRSAGTAHSR